MNLNELRDEAYSVAKANGWHEEEHSDSHWLMLVITEIAEAVQADRKGHHARVDKFIDDMAYKDNEDGDTWFRLVFAQNIGNTVEDELADVVIRCLDLAGLRGYDLQNLLSDPDGSKEFEETFGGKTFAEIAFAFATTSSFRRQKQPCTASYATWFGTAGSRASTSPSSSAPRCATTGCGDTATEEGGTKIMELQTLTERK